MPYHLAKAEFAIKYVSKVMTPLIRWLIKSGVGYKDFNNHIKRLFFEQASLEALHSQTKSTDSALSLLAGLNRRDVSYFKDNPAEVVNASSEILSTSSRVITLWVSKNWDRHLPMYGEDISFESLCKEVSQDTHPKTVLLDLERLGLVSIEGNTVLLHSESFTPSNTCLRVQGLLAQSTTDHLSAGLTNIFEPQNMFLEQALNADELTPESIQELRNFSTQLWNELSQQLMQKAIECSKRDQGKEDANYRFTFGVYQYNEFWNKEK